MVIYDYIWFSTMMIMVIYGFPQWWLLLLMVINPSEKLIIMVDWLVVEPYPSEKYEFVSWDDDIPNWMESHKKCSKAPTRVDHKYMDHFLLKLLESILLFWTQTRLDWIGYPALPKRRPKLVKSLVGHCSIFAGTRPRKMRVIYKTNSTWAVFKTCGSSSCMTAS